ncbi:FecR domain-containing protein [Steroidobacter sp. S1-65]|uniref:FecR domain-containing protein n=1 Tax=Steroidobacter gossypii TaxID=2805490 RepID=A0ABS1X0J4_9GAMM|nr:FecR domain-containing protein [Steroidobacter gossypii]MBM0106760.1 FecR domain-containing protein [Steroidobacter gossypii]
MTNVYPLPPQKRNVDEASEWLAKLDRGLSAAEQQELQAWLSQHPEHRRSLLRLAALWDKMDTLSRLSELFPSAHPRQRRRLRHSAIAASLAMVIVVGWLAVQYSAEPPSAPADPTFAEVTHLYETAIGERSTVRLPDQSVLTLNTNSLVNVTYNSVQRVLVLQRGEMSIEVAHDPRRTLSVIAGQKRVRAVGTAFNVQIIDDAQVELIVTEGTVVVDEDIERAGSAPTTPRTVTKGEKVLLGVDRETISKVSDSALSAELSWRQGNLVFRGETLAVAIAEVSRYTPIQFEIADERLKQLRIGGLFKAGDVDGLLATLKENFNIDSERLDAERVLLKAP